MKKKEEEMVEERALMSEDGARASPVTRSLQKNPGG